MLIVEDGTMPEGANSYVSLEEADAWLVPRGLWKARASRKEAALIRAFDALNTLVWRGSAPDWRRVTAWPRVGVPLPGGGILPGNLIPPAVRQAQMELAALILGGLNPLAPLERGGRIKARSESFTEGAIDVLGGDATSASVTYADSAPVEQYLPSVYGILRPWLAEIPGTSGLACASVYRG